VVTADTVLIQGTYPLAEDCPASMPRSFELPVGPLPAGEYPTFEVEVAWINQHGGGATGKGRPVRLSEESGYFWFFDPEISEVTIKILDGRVLSSHYWIFLASMTDVDVTVTVRQLMGSFCQDQGTCPTLTYHLPPGAVEGIADLQAF